MDSSNGETTPAVRIDKSGFLEKVLQILKTASFSYEIR